MNQGILNKILLVGFIFLHAQFIPAQIVKTTDPNLTIDLTKGILAVFPCLSGSLFLNDHYLTGPFGFREMVMLIDLSDYINATDSQIIIFNMQDINL